MFTLRYYTIYIVQAEKKQIVVNIAHCDYYILAVQATAVVCRSVINYSKQP